MAAAAQEAFNVANIAFQEANAAAEVAENAAFSAPKNVELRKRMIDALAAYRVASEARDVAAKALLDAKEAAARNAPPSKERRRSRRSKRSKRSQRKTTRRN
jgi:hypothetical protein